MGSGGYIILREGYGIPDTYKGTGTVFLTPLMGGVQNSRHIIWEGYRIPARTAKIQNIPQISIDFQDFDVSGTLHIKKAKSLHKLLHQYFFINSTFREIK